MSERMVNFGGIVQLSTVDWTGRSSIVIFLRGCPLRCPHCHNQALQSGNNSVDIYSVIKNIVNIKTFGCDDDATGQIALDDASQRVLSNPVVDALVLSGGEPLMQNDATIALAKAAKGLKLKVGLETCGYYPENLMRLLKCKLEYHRKEEATNNTYDDELSLIDKVFLDIKAVLDDHDFKKYEKATGIAGAAPRILESLEILMNQRVPLEIRIAIFPEAQYKRDLMQIARHIAKLIKKYPNNKIESIVLYQGRPLNGEFKPIEQKDINPLSNAVNGIINNVNKQVKIKIETTVRSDPIPKGQISNSRKNICIGI